MAAGSWTRFFWSDWAGDPALRVCSLAAQGLWMRMLCIAAEANPTGYVTVNGLALGVTDIARMAGVTETECASLLAELDRKGVFSRNRRGVIYSRRMIREARRAAKARKDGRTGGNPGVPAGKVPKERRARHYRKSDSAAKTRAVFERGGGRCHWCQGVLAGDAWHVGHLVGIRDGGTSELANLALECENCHRSRHCKDVRNSTDDNPVDNPQRPDTRNQEEEKRKEADGPGILHGRDNADPSAHRALVSDLRERGHGVLTDFERTFLGSVFGLRTLSRKQRETLEAIRLKVGELAGAPAAGEWEPRLDWARRNRQWARKWGGMPYQQGCLIPAHLLRPGDGEGWTEWRPAC